MHEHHALRHITADALAHLGIEQVAYVKPVTLEDGGTAFAIHAADGQEMAMLADREVAFATVRQNDLEPVSVH
jgi:hypothetical protein